MHTSVRAFAKRICFFARLSAHSRYRAPNRRRVLNRRRHKNRSFANPTVVHSARCISLRKPCFSVAFLAEIHGFWYRIVTSSCLAFQPQNTKARSHFPAYFACFLEMTLLLSVDGIISGGQGPIVIVIAIVKSTIALLPYRKIAKLLFSIRNCVR